jgi:hypothetical protein
MSHANLSGIVITAASMYLLDPDRGRRRRRRAQLRDRLGAAAQGKTIH